MHGVANPTYPTILLLYIFANNLVTRFIIGFGLGKHLDSPYYDQ